MPERCTTANDVVPSLLENVDNEGMSDAEFRAFSRQQLFGVTVRDSRCLIPGDETSRIEGPARVLDWLQVRLSIGRKLGLASKAKDGLEYQPEMEVG